MRYRDIATENIQTLLRISESVPVIEMSKARVMPELPDGIRWPKLKLDESLDYKEIAKMIDSDFLLQGVRAEALTGVRLSKIDDADHQMVFLMQSSKGQPYYVCTVRFKDYEWDLVVDDTTLKPIERARHLMFDGKVELNCTCPSFLYHGYRFLLDKHDASIYPENRPPKKNNPQQRGIVCKHMNRVIRAFPFYAADLAKHIKENHPVAAGKSRSWDVKSKTAELLRKNKKTDVEYGDIT